MTDSEPASLLPTRRSLLSKIKDSGHHEAWREFFDLYWKLIFGTARRAGLDENEAQDVVQDTMLTVSKEMPGFRYDRSKGKFKNWLLVITRRRVADSPRKRYRTGHVSPVDVTAPEVEAKLASLESDNGAQPDDHWEAEWRIHVLEAAMKRVKNQVKPEHFQAFHLSVIDGHSAVEISRVLGISSMNLYMIRHRIGALVKKEVKRLENGTI